MTQGWEEDGKGSVYLLCCTMLYWNKIWEFQCHIINDIINFLLFSKVYKIFHSFISHSNLQSIQRINIRHGAHQLCTNTQFLCGDKWHKTRLATSKTFPVSLPQISFWEVSQTVTNVHINPLTDGIQIKASLMGGGIECPPSKILENEATESCEGSK